MTNYTYPTNVSRWSDLFAYGNTVTGYWFGNVILIMIFIIAITRFSNLPPARAITMAGLITSILGTFMYWLALISPTTLIICIIITACGLVFTKGEESTY